MILAIHQPQYMPWLGYFHKMACADRFVFLDDVQFKKNEWQHRNRIRGQNGPQWISVPTHYRFPQKILEVRVLNERNWKREHLNALRTCYGRAPFFNNYAPELETFFAKEYETVDILNADSVRLLNRWLGITTPIEISSQYRFPGESTERLVNICRHFGADTYLAGVGGKDYMDLSLFQSAGIRVVFQQFSCPCYSQHCCQGSGEFISSLSALDLVFNHGPQSHSILFEGKNNPRIALL